MGFIETAGAGFPWDAIYGGRFFTAYPDHCNCDNGVPPCRLLILGNSITYSPVQVGSQWYGTWGMAANRAETDYVHQVAQAMADRLQQPVRVKMAAIWLWERDFATFDYSQLAEYRDFLPDYFIYRAGDNIPDTEPNLPVLGTAIGALIDYIVNNRAVRVMVTGVFYSRYLVDPIARAVAGLRSLPFATFIDMWAIAGYHASEQPDPGVAIHPNQVAHDEIARRIVASAVAAGMF